MSENDTYSLFFLSSSQEILSDGENRAYITNNNTHAQTHTHTRTHTHTHTHVSGIQGTDGTV